MEGGGGGRGCWTDAAEQETISHSRVQQREGGGGGGGGLGGGGARIQSRLAGRLVAMNV